MSASLCLLLGALVVTLPTDRLTLAWTHSVQKTPWEEDYRLEEGALRLAEARIQGSGAGMEVPPGAVLRDGIYHYRPALDRLPELRLALSHYTPGYRLCWDGTCRGLAELLRTEEEGTATLRGCDG